MYFTRGSLRKSASPLNAKARSTESVGHIHVPFLTKRAKSAEAFCSSKLSRAAACSSIAVSWRIPSVRSCASFFFLSSVSFAEQATRIPIKCSKLFFAFVNVHVPQAGDQKLAGGVHD